MTQPYALGIWLIERDDAAGYDEYDSAVVYAATEDAARRLHPNGYSEPTPYWDSSWVAPERVKVTRIGTAWDGATEGVVCASFNAG